MYISIDYKKIMLGMVKWHSQKWMFIEMKIRKKLCKNLFWFVSTSAVFL